MKIKLKTLRALEKEMWNVGRVISDRLGLRQFGSIMFRNEYDDWYCTKPIVFKAYSDMGNQTHSITLEEFALISTNPDAYFKPFEEKFKDDKLKAEKETERRERVQLDELLKKYPKGEADD